MTLVLLKTSIKHTTKQRKTKWTTKNCCHIYDFLFLSLYRHGMNKGISKQIQCVWASKELCPIFMVLIRVRIIIWREERRERGSRRKTEKMLRGEAKVILNKNYPISDPIVIVIKTSLSSCRQLQQRIHTTTQVLIRHPLTIFWGAY